MPPSATDCDVTTVQLSNGTVQKIHKILLFIEIYISLYVYRYVRAKMIVHVFMIELDQRSIDIQEKFEIVKIYVQCQ